MGEPAFRRSKETRGWPDPLCNDTSRLSDGELADYIAVCEYNFDGLSPTAREALVRLLRHAAAVKAGYGGEVKENVK